MVNWTVIFIIGGGVLFGCLFCGSWICLCYYIKKNGGQNGGRGYTGGGGTGGIGGDFSGGDGGGGDGGGGGGGGGDGGGGG